MNIAILASSFHPNLGGVEELVRQLAKTQIGRGDRTLVCTNRWPRNLPARETFDGLPLRRFKFRLPTTPGFVTWAAGALGPLAQGALRRELRRHRTEVVHVQCVGPNAHYALRASEHFGLPLVVTLQGELTMDPDQVFRRYSFVRSLLHRSLAAADVITACSKRTLDDAERFHGRPFGDRARVIFNGASPEDFARAPRFVHPRPFVLALGRLVPEKGFDMLLTAMACDRLRSHDVVLAGAGPETSNLRRLVLQLGLADRAHLLGHTDRATTAALFNGADFVVVPSRADEGLPVVCAEALAAGRPCIGTAVGGVPEAIVDGETGLLVPRGDVEALRRAIELLVRNADLRARMAAASRRRAERFSWETIAGQYDAAYRDAIRRRASRAAVPRVTTRP